MDLKTGHPHGQTVSREHMGLFDGLAVDQRAVAGVEIANDQGTADFADLAMDPADPGVIQTDIGARIASEDDGQMPHGDLTLRHTWSNADKLHVHDDLQQRKNRGLPEATCVANSMGRAFEGCTTIGFGRNNQF
jgi:hypothetical protein